MACAHQSLVCLCRQRNCIIMLTDIWEELPQNFQEPLAKNWMEVEMEKMQLFHLKMILWVVVTMVWHLLHYFTVLITSNKGGGKCFASVCLSVRLSVRLSVYLSVSKITQKCMHGFVWNVACWQMSGHGQTD